MAMESEDEQPEALRNRCGVEIASNNSKLHHPRSRAERTTTGWRHWRLYLTLAGLGVMQVACKGEDCEPPPSFPIGTRFQVELLGQVEDTYEDCDWIGLRSSQGFVIEAGPLHTFKQVPDTSECTVQNLADVPQVFPIDYTLDECTFGPGYYMSCTFGIPECPEEGLGTLTLRLDEPPQAASTETEVYITSGIRCQTNFDSCAERHRILVTRIDDSDQRG